MKIIYELIEGKPIMSNPILIEDDAEIPKGHVELDGSVSYTESGEVFSPTLDEWKQSKLSEIDQKCNSEILAGFTSSCLGVSHFYSFDSEAQMNLAGTLNAINAGLIQAPIMWSADGVATAHTFDQFKALYMDGYNHKLSNQARYWTLKGQILAATEEFDVVW
jgi:hypothetical protein